MNKPRRMTQEELDQAVAQFDQAYQKYLAENIEKEKRQKQEQELFDQAFPQLMQRLKDKTRQEGRPGKAGDKERPAR